MLKNQTSQMLSKSKKPLAKKTKGKKQLTPKLVDPRDEIKKEKPVIPTIPSVPKMDEGGLLQEGGTVDPVSGNAVPVGSTQEEVRDDIPAQLSEGEFIFPADVVRFIGLDNLMKLRQEAKEGLAKMDRMGQMGNADEATESDTQEFDTDIDDIIGEIEAQSQNVSSKTPSPEPSLEGEDEKKKFSYLT